MKRLTRVALASTVVVAAILGSAVAANATKVPKPHLVFTTLAVAGDSTTELPDSWTHDLPTRERSISGYAHGGFTSGRILEHLTKTDSNVLVVMVGVNDVTAGYSNKHIIHNVWKIIAKVGAQHVIISAIVPNDLTNYGPKHINRRAAGASLNVALRATAVAHGWEFIDPDGAFRLPNNGYAPGTTVDGVHPTRAAFAAESAVLAPAIAAAAD